jgi:hypothetical protein
MIRIDCDTFDQIDAVWRMLTHVPDDAFSPVEIYLNGRFRYRVVRSDGEQTTAPVEGPPASSSPAP